MERLSIQGDFFDCQLYGGRLYLWTFEGSLEVYNYQGIILEWLNRTGGNLRKCQPYEGGESEICIDSCDLQKFLIYKRDYLTDEFPVSTEVLSGGLYEANAKGLFTCKLPMFQQMAPAEKIWDAPLVYVKGEKYRGLVCAAGSDGMYWMPTLKDKNIIQLSSKQTIRASFCRPGIYAHSSEGRAYLLLKKHGYIYDKSFMSDKDLYPDMKIAHGAKMTWSWDEKFYIAEDHTLKVYSYVSANEPLILNDTINFLYWKGEFVSAGSSRCGTIVELDNAICLFEDWTKEDGHCTIIGPITRWRMYPRSIRFSSHVHVIFDDRMDIVVMNDDIRHSIDERLFWRYRR